MNLERGSEHRDHNFDVLADWNPEINATLFSILSEDIKRGHEGKIHSCAAAQALKVYFGNDCCPRVDEDRHGRLFMEVSDHKAHVRYHADLRLFDGAFSPERFDYEKGMGLPSRPGPLMIMNVVQGKRPVDKHPPDKDRSHRHPRSETKREPRNWSKAKMELTVKDPVNNILSGETKSVVNTDLFQ